jgi:hypothetical protein
MSEYLCGCAAEGCRGARRIISSHLISSLILLIMVSMQQERVNNLSFSSAGRHGNDFWIAEENNIGTKLLNNMGWKAGEGLGVNGRGSKKFISAKAKYDSNGIGKVNKSRDEAWSEANSLYNDLLSRLAAQHNNSDNNNEINSSNKEEEDHNTTSSNVKNYIAKRSLYNKFKKAKQTENYTEEQKQQILGVKNKVQQKQEEAEASQDYRSADSSLITTTSTINLKEYFNKKLNANKNCQANNIVTEKKRSAEMSAEESQKERKRAKKAKKEKKKEKE